MSREPPAMSTGEAWLVLASSLEPLAPPSGGRDRLLAAVAAAEPYRALLPGLAAAFDLSARALHDLLGRMNDPGAWMPGVGGVVAFLDFQSGPRLGSSHCGVARMKDGFSVPRHRHVTRELNFVLEGGLVDDAGATYSPGQLLDAPAGSSHALRIIGEPEAVLVSLLSSSEFDGPP
jgi:quercetin dioxygenase-like cupin family protein